MHRAVALVFLLVASAALGEAQHAPAASPKSSKAAAPAHEKSDDSLSQSPSVSATSPAAPSPKTKSTHVAAAPSTVPADSPSEFPVSADAPATSGPAAADGPLASAPAPDAAAVSDQNSGAAKTTGAFVGGAVAVWIAVSAF